MIEQIVLEIKRKIELELNAQPTPSVYTFSLSGEFFRSNEGFCDFKIHFLDPSASGGVRHVNLLNKQKITLEDYGALNSWMENAGKKYNVQRRVSSDLVGPS